MLHQVLMVRVKKFDIKTCKPGKKITIYRDIKPNPDLLWKNVKKLEKILWGQTKENDRFICCKTEDLSWCPVIDNTRGALCIMCNTYYKYEEQEVMVID